MIIHIMKWAYMSGFTIVEVMIALGISGVILASSITVFSGRRSSTEFSQTMYDLQSKFQSYSTEASTARLPNETYICNKSSTLNNGKLHAYLTPAAPTNESVSNQNCILLGKAIQIIPGSGTIYSYPVLGLRTTASGSFPTTPSEANPEPALDVTGNNWYMVEAYSLLNGATVVSAKFSGSATEQGLLLLYASLQSSNPGGQAGAYSRGVTFTEADVKSSKLRDCIEEVACGTASTLSTAWNLCVQNNAGDRNARLILRNTSTGITASLNMAGCL